MIHTTSLTEFFHEEVTASQKVVGDVPEEIEAYIVNLLVDYAGPARPLPGEEALAITYLEALSLESKFERFQVFRDLGDLALYISGFFAEYIEKSLVGMDYYVGMGVKSYDGVVEAMQGSPMAALYEMLAEYFGQMVEVVSEVADRCRGDDDKSVMVLYERWLATGSPRARQKLLELGMFPTNVVGRG